EAVAGRARAEGIVEGEQAWLRRFVQDAARATLEPLAEAMRADRRAAIIDLDGERRPVALVERGLDGVRQPRSRLRIGSLDPDSIDDHRERRGPSEWIEIGRRFLE